MTCLACASHHESVSEPELLTAASAAGESARQRYEQLDRRRRNKIANSGGEVAQKVAAALNTGERLANTWAKGAEAERKTAKAFEKSLVAGTIVLHDRSVPGTKGNIDHLVVSRSGVWVVDTKSTEGHVEVINTGGFFSPKHELRIDGKKRAKLVTGLDWQLIAVRAAVYEIDPDVAVYGALCFPNALWNRFSPGGEVDTIDVNSPARLAKIFESTAKYSEDHRLHVAQELAQVFTQKGS